MPVVWALTGARVGDNAQVVQFAEALGFEVREVPLDYGGLRMLPNWLLGGTLATLSSAARSRIQPPWPDLIIGAGQRSVPVARWIKRQSGGKARLVFLGRPRSPLAWFDLVITTPQYGLPPEDNVKVVALPYPRSPDAADDLGEWPAKWRDVRRPLTAVLIGGSSTPYRLDKASIEGLVDQAAAAGGHVVFATSPRTSVAEADLLEELVNDAAEVWRWAPETPNPYRVLLQLADQFVVTEDSVSMIADACATGKPVSVAPVARSAMMTWQADSGVLRWLAKNGILSPPRDVRRLVSMLARNGQVTMAGADSAAAMVGEMTTWPEVVEQVRGLVR